MPNEPMATHARRRLRLTQSQNPDPNLPQPDPSLWIIHYQQSEPQNHYPSRNIRTSDQVRLTMSERMQLQRQGQLVRKEFMLRDSASWPTINIPGNSNAGYAQQAMGYPNDVMAHMNRNQQQAYIQQQQATASQRGVGPSPAKRPRHNGPGHGHGSATAIPAPVLLQDSGNEDEDGTVGGDYMDYLTPRDISLHRYLQHHEWLEEILESPYDTNQIIPGELGLGRKGELESLTNDFFNAPVEGTLKVTFPTLTESPTHKEDSVTPRVGRLEAGKAEEFTKRATERVAEINAEMEKLKRQHARRMAKLNRGRALQEAEESIRAETLEILSGDFRRSRADPDSKINEHAQKIVGRKITPLLDIECVQKGCLEEKSGARDSNEQDYDMVDNFNLDGVQSEAPAPSEPEERTLTNHMNAVEPPTSFRQMSTPETSHNDGTTREEVPVLRKQSKDTTAEDWIMVNKDVNSGAEDQELGDLDSFAHDAATQPDTDTPAAIGTPDGDAPPGFEPGQEVVNDETFEQGGGSNTAGEFETNDFGEGIDFGDLDTTEADLYADGIDTGELDEHGEIENVDSAFGEAFQSTDADSAPGP